MSRGNRTLIYDSVNRGNLRAIQVFNPSIPHRPSRRTLGRGDQRRRCHNNPSRLRDAGDGFLFRQGYTIVASGWPGDALPGRQPADGRFSVAAEPDGKPITKLITHRLAFTKPRTPSAWAGTAPIRALIRGMERAGEAQLYRRAGSSAPRETIPRASGRSQVPRRQERCRERRRRVLPGRLLA
jgi:hypothetical protein